VASECTGYHEMQPAQDVPPARVRRGRMIRQARVPPAGIPPLSVTDAPGYCLR
jgi:hypothetical protein